MGDADHGQSRRAGERFLRTAAENVDLRLAHVHGVAEHTGDRIHHRQDAVFLQDRAEGMDVVEHAAGGIAVHEGGVLEGTVLFEEGAQRFRRDGRVRIDGIQHRLSAVELHKIGKALAVEAVIEHEHAVARLGERGAGGLQAENALAAQDKGRVGGIEKMGILGAGNAVKLIKRGIEVGVGGLQGARHAHVFRDLGGARREDIVHSIKPPCG